MPQVTSGSTGGSPDRRHETVERADQDPQADQRKHRDERLGRHGGQEADHSGKAEDDKAVNPTTDPAEPVLINVARAGVYVVGKDIPSGLWGSAYIQNKHMPTADLQAISIDGVTPTLYQSADGREHVSFSGDTTAGGDGQRMKDNAWDFAVALEDGQTVTVAAPLSTPFHHYRSLSS